MFDTLPIVVDPLFVVKENVPVKVFTEDIAERIAVFCADVSVIVLFTFPVLDCAGIVIVVITVEPFFISSVYVNPVE